MYILYIWTVIAMTPHVGSAYPKDIQRDWRPIGEYHSSTLPPQLPQEKCEAAAKQLGLSADRYRCVRAK
jgi:hypothetical protein